MRKYTPLFPVLALAACASTGVSQTENIATGRDDGLADLTIEIAVEVQEGDVYLALFDSKEKYEAGQPLAQAGKPASPTVTFTAEGITAGLYAARIYHDLNGNGQLDTNAIGMPKEPFAFSNGAKPNFGPPGWDAMAFEVTAPATVHKMEIK